MYRFAGSFGVKKCLYSGLAVGYGGIVYQTTKTEQEYFDYLDDLRANAELTLKVKNESRNLFHSRKNDMSSSMVEIDELPDPHAITKQCLSSEVMDAIALKPIQADEVSMAVESLLSLPQVEKLIPNDLLKSPEKCQKLFKKVANIMTNPDKVAKSLAILKNLEESHSPELLMIASEAEEQKQQALKLESQPGLPYTNTEWDTLKEMYLCTLCDDVLSASNILPGCSHSFCGMCIEQHMHGNAATDDHSIKEGSPQSSHTITTSTSLTTAGGSNILSHTCPHADCTSTFSYTIFQRTFDDFVSVSVEAVPNCYLKKLWCHRRAEYTALQKTREIAKEAARRVARGEGNTNSDDDDDDADLSGYLSMLGEDWEDIVIKVVCVLLVLVMVARRNG